MPNSSTVPPSGANSPQRSGTASICRRRWAQQAHQLARGDGQRHALQRLGLAIVFTTSFRSQHGRRRCRFGMASSEAAAIWWAICSRCSRGCGCGGGCRSESRRRCARGARPAPRPGRQACAASSGQVGDEHGGGTGRLEQISAAQRLRSPAPAGGPARRRARQAAAGRD